MNRKPKRYQLILAALLLCLLCIPVQAQDNRFQFMSPRFGTSRDWLEYSIDHKFHQGISDQPTDFSVTEHYLSVPGYRSLSEDHEFFVGASLSVLDVDTEAMFPNTADSFPEYFANPQLRLAYKERIEGNKIWGTSLTIGSPSDRPFASIHEVSLSATAFLRLPVDQSDDAWILLLNFANDRSFLQYVPLPGIAYVHRPSEDFMAYLGVPFIYVKYNPAPRWTLRASYVIPRTVHANVSYELSEELTLHGGFDWSSNTFFRHDRRDDDDRLFYYDKTLSAGIRWDITNDLYVDFSAGYCFDRFFFEGEDYDDRSFNRINIGDGPFVALRAAIALDKSSRPPTKDFR